MFNVVIGKARQACMTMLWGVFRMIYGCKNVDIQHQGTMRETLNKDKKDNDFSKAKEKVLVILWFKEGWYALKHNRLGI